MAGNTQPLVTDVNSLAAPQYFNTITNAYEYVNGNNGNLYSIPGPITPYHTQAGTGYEEKNVVKNLPGIFYGLSGTMNNINNPRWIMVFNAISQPTTGTVPLIQVSVVQAVSGQGDTNFSYNPTHPYTMSTGIYIASSSTGGQYTPAGTADCFYMVDYN
jgi:hypothetical protein